MSILDALPQPQAPGAQQPPVPQPPQAQSPISPGLQALITLQQNAAPTAPGPGGAPQPTIAAKLVQQQAQQAQQAQQQKQAGILAALQQAKVAAPGVAQLAAQRQALQQSQLAQQGMQQQQNPGITSLPAPNIGGFAGGGIVAFEDGGDTDSAPVEDKWGQALAKAGNWFISPTDINLPRDLPNLINNIVSGPGSSTFNDFANIVKPSPEKPKEAPQGPQFNIAPNNLVNARMQMVIGNAPPADLAAFDTKYPGVKEAMERVASAGAGKNNEGVVAAIPSAYGKTPSTEGGLNTNTNASNLSDLEAAKKEGQYYSTAADQGLEKPDIKNIENKQAAFLAIRANRPDFFQQANDALAENEQWRKDLLQQQKNQDPIMGMIAQLKSGPGGTGSVDYYNNVVQQREQMDRQLSLQYKAMVINNMQAAQALKEGDAATAIDFANKNAALQNQYNEQKAKVINAIIASKVGYYDADARVRAAQVQAEAEAMGVRARVVDQAMQLAQTDQAYQRALQDSTALPTAPHKSGMKMPNGQPMTNLDYTNYVYNKSVAAKLDALGKAVNAPNLGDAWRNSNGLDQYGGAGQFGAAPPGAVRQIK